MLGVQWDFGAQILLSEILDEEKSQKKQGHHMKTDASLSLGLVQHSVSPKCGISKLECTTYWMGLSEVICLLESTYPASHKDDGIPQSAKLQESPTTWQWEMSTWAGFFTFKAQEPPSPISKRMSWVPSKQMSACLFVKSYEVDEESGNDPLHA